MTQAYLHPVCLWVSDCYTHTSSVSVLADISLFVLFLLYSSLIKISNVRPSRRFRWCFLFFFIIILYQLVNKDHNRAADRKRA